MYYKGMVGMCTILLACCAYFLQGIFVKSNQTWDYMIKHDVEFQQVSKDQSKLIKEVEIINNYLKNTQLVKLNQKR